MLTFTDTDGEAMSELATDDHSVSATDFECSEPTETIIADEAA